MGECNFNGGKECRFGEEPEDKDWCLICAIMQAVEVQKQSNQIMNVLSLSVLRQTLLRTLPYENSGVQDKVKSRLMKAAKNLSDNHEI
ncbi:hypothetical protein AKJ54_00270 [candidate division MSBL1 archaeon SCGC-AAA382K21]|uniref:Uncharacterized protein n=1 Tax=candidate division MSBL1 archaeon SCGC-AAA382K21 TaxID=1698283 RepID=A0A133VLU1_9EURY|nr:hypothetical protein AKJ54_00270 [candidate division MSBL1 archaeon SCGC-AAA382K21]